MTKKEKEDEIIKFIKETAFYKGLNDDEIDKVMSIIKSCEGQPRQVLILRIAQLIIKWDRFQVFY